MFAISRFVYRPTKHVFFSEYSVPIMTENIFSFINIINNYNCINVHPSAKYLHVGRIVVWFCKTAFASFVRSRLLLFWNICSYLSSLYFDFMHATFVWVAHFHIKIKHAPQIHIKNDRA